MSGHTPGPWFVREYSVDGWDGATYQCCDIEGWDHNRIVANLPDYKHPNCDDGNCEANARLIAEAPSLLNALTVLADAAEARGIPCDAARATIARATGASA